MSNASDFTVRSADGTTIGAERVGEGPPVVLIGGAFNDRTTTRALAQVLAPRSRRSARLVLSLANRRLILSSLAERSVGYQSWSV
jgi:pimeloyl-ACP methyl ester carboxylesterase